MNVASALEEPERRKLLASQARLRAGLAGMYKRNQELFSGRRTNYPDTQERNTRVAEAFAQAL
jgi:hypothetical protein